MPRATPVAPAGAGPAVVRAARHGDRAAWGCLYRAYSRMVHAILLARVPRHDAEDLTHDVFARAMRSIGTLRDDGSVGPWLAAAARNLAIDHARRARRAPRGEGAEPAAPSAPAPLADEAAAALEAIQRLPEAYRETLLMRFVEGLTGPEIAARTGMTHGSVRVNLCRGMELLRIELSPPEAP
jgi:RNA polymerase sigma-70 factor (ECF subfamily)